MARTVRKHFLAGASVVEARQALINWLSANGFRIITLAADGVTKQYPTPEVLLPQDPGRAVANIDAQLGEVAGINVAYAPRGRGWPLIAVLGAVPHVEGGIRGTLVTGGFFFATFAGVPSLGVREWPVSPSVWGVGGLIRAKAWPMLQRFDATFGGGRLLDSAIRDQPLVSPETELRAVQQAAGVPVVGTPGTAEMATQVARTSTVQTVGLIVQAASTVYTLFAVITLFPAVGVSGILLIEAARGRMNLLTALFTAGVVGGTVLLGYSVYIANYRISRPVQRGITEGVARRALGLGIGATIFGVLFGIAIPPIPFIWVVAGALYLAAYFRLQRGAAPPSTP